jgi:hypothetical protein
MISDYWQGFFLGLSVAAIAINLTIMLARR